MTESVTPSETTATPQTAPSSSEQAPAPQEASRLERLRELLEIDSGENPDGNAHESAEPAEPNGKPKGKPKAIKELAEPASVSVEDLYAIEVPMGSGKPLTIGALKDIGAKDSDLSVRELAFAEKVSQQEADWTRAQRELEQLVAGIDPRAIKPEVRERVRQQIAESTKRERELTLQHIPQWANETVRDSELAGMVELLRDYGISEAFLTANPNHKVFRFVRDAFLRKQRITEALAKVAEVKKPSTTGRSAAGNAPARAPASEKKPNRSTLRDRVLGVLQ